MTVWQALGTSPFGFRPLLAVTNIGKAKYGKLKLRVYETVAVWSIFLFYLHYWCAPRKIFLLWIWYFKSLILNQNWIIYRKHWILTNLLQSLKFMAVKGMWNSWKFHIFDWNGCRNINKIKHVKFTCRTTVYRLDSRISLAVLPG